MLAGFEGASGDYDVAEVPEVDPVELQIEIEYCLRLKGFCVLGSGLEPEVLEEACSDLERLREEPVLFMPTQPEVLDGILGSRGTGEFCEMSDLGDDSESMKAVRDCFDSLSGAGCQFCREAGFVSVTPSLTVAVRGGEPDAHNELTEGTCMGWLSTFKLGRLMVMLHLGPGEGTLELTPYDEESGAVEIKTQPGMVVILRYDALMRNHITTSNDFSLVRWVFAKEKTGPRGWRELAAGLQRKQPALRELFAWAHERMQKVLGLEDEYGMTEGGVTSSREWELMMHHHFFKRDRIPAAVRGVATHMPGLWEPEAYWQTVNEGVDYCMKVPFTRWDHDVYYDADPDCWLQASTWKYSPNMGRTSVQHGTFLDGIELFDNKFFGLSVMEAKGMDPQQRHILETTYECMFQGGFKKKDLMNSEIAVYIGTTNPEVNYIDMDMGACSGTGSAVAITSNRISFQLGMMGPSSSVECGMCSAHMAIQVGISAILPHHTHRLATGGLSIAADVGGVFFSITPFNWPRFNWSMNPVGRCFAFDECANGYVRGEAVGNLCLLPYAEKLDGEWTVPDRHCFGTLVGNHSNSNGRSASLTAPNGPAQAECLHEALRAAAINPLDLDGLDCHGIGGLLEDSVELTAASAVLRGMKGGDAEVLTVGSNKTNVAAVMEAAGVIALFKVFFNIVYGTQAPTNHLKQLNPHINIGDEAAVLFNTESIAYRERTSFHASAAQGSYTGMNAVHIAWYMADEAKVRTDPAAMSRGVFSFWPGGGGSLESEQLPGMGYFILGSWSRWEEPEEMKQEGPGVYVHTVTLGPNRFESFQIWLDGASERVLHPGSAHGMPGDAVRGPVDASRAEGYAWVIEGRSTVYPYKLENSEGRIGDRYEVRLLASGKYRTVTWRRLPPAEGEAIEDQPVVDSGSYYVAVEWAGWRLFEMQPSEEVPGLHTASVALPRAAKEGDFQIVRDRDWAQTFFPPLPDGETPPEGEQVLGPGDAEYGNVWRIKGRTGEIFKVEFQRAFEGGVEHRRVSWRGLG